jgi:U32 family peptidase
MDSNQTNPMATPERNASRAPVRLPELLAPAGDWECAKAAVENGADAIYFGLERFNARMRASNFTEADLPKLMEFLHRRGVKGYVTFNILVFENEMAEAEQYARAMIAAGVDAAVVQDVGICRLIRQISPDFPIHVSTQMTITSAAGIEFARELGGNLVVLARECSLKEIAALQSAQLKGSQLSTFHKPRSDRDSPLSLSLSPSEGERVPKAGEGLVHGPGTRREAVEAIHRPLPLEVFIHGALCVAYSGQCLTSEALGGRSANRGECAQACRMPYELVADGKLVPLGDRKYLLSPQDLAGLEVLPELVRLGVASLKIEGRLKSPEYVANITRIYRRAIDRLGGCLEADVPGSSRSQGSDVEIRDQKSEIRNRESLLTSAATGSQGALSGEGRVTSDDCYGMEMAFSRGLYTGWFRGTNNQALVHGRFGKKRGVFLGEVSRVEGESVQIMLQGPLKPGDGVVFDAGHPEEEEEGGRIYEVRSPKSEGRNGGLAELRFGRGDMDFGRIHVGDKLWKTSDPELDRRLRQSFEGETPRFRRPIQMEVHGLAGKPLTLIARDELGHVVRFDSAMPLARATNQPLTTDRLQQQLGRLGGTLFKLGELNNLLDGEVVLPVSELNRLRREAVRELEALRAHAKRWSLECGVRSAECGIEEMATATSIPHSVLRTPHLIVLVRDFAQLEAVLETGLETLYCEFEDPKRYREAVALVRRYKSETGVPVEIFVAPPRIFKMGEEWTLKQTRSCEADGYLVRNYDHLRFFASDRRIGDYSLNIANRLAADYFRNKFSLERVTASYDLNFAQLEALLQAAPPEWFEVTIHQHMPMFHMEHCVFCAFLSSGTDYTNCGRPCDRHDLKLRDRVGAEHPVKADAGCRNTVFNARAQTGADYVSRMLALGVRHYRIEFLNETPGQAAQMIARYRQLLRGEITGPQLWRELKLLNQLGVTRGQIGSPARV